MKDDHFTRIKAIDATARRAFGCGTAGEVAAGSGSRCKAADRACSLWKSQMLLHFVTDEPTKLPAIRAIFEPQHRVIPWLLGGRDPEVTSHGVLMVDVDLRRSARVDQTRLILKQLGRVPEKLFVVHNLVRSLVAQAYALGATTVISRAKEAIPRIAQIEKAEAAAQPDIADPASAMDAGARAFASMFANVRDGKPVKLADAEHATSLIIKRVGQDGLAAWLDEVRRYHEGTFQHCLLVTGVAVGFGINVGFTDADVARLGMAATLHDIGKARIPLSILDKPGRLEPLEEEIMRRHPVIGYDLLADLPDVGAELLDGVRHHHEYLDGSGYPDGLKASQISDPVRLLTISDIFSALIESRPYRSPMSRQAAYDILCGMEGKLEGPLLRAFRKVALAG
jgi:HD-GYP domain-containing protein (c-di-GMP phosphodiesterase class II)